MYSSYKYVHSVNGIHLFVEVCVCVCVCVCACVPLAGYSDHRVVVLVNMIMQCNLFEFEHKMKSCNSKYRYISQNTASSWPSHIGVMLELAMDCTFKKLQNAFDTWICNKHMVCTMNCTVNVQRIQNLPCPTSIWSLKESCMNRS